MAVKTRKLRSLVQRTSKRTLISVSIVTLLALGGGITFAVNRQSGASVSNTADSAHVKSASTPATNESEGAACEKSVTTTESDNPPTPGTTPASGTPANNKAKPATNNNTATPAPVSQPSTTKPGSSNPTPPSLTPPAVNPNATFYVAEAAGTYKDKATNTLVFAYKVTREPGHTAALSSSVYAYGTPYVSCKVMSDSTVGMTMVADMPAGFYGCQLTVTDGKTTRRLDLTIHHSGGPTNS